MKLRLMVTLLALGGVLTAGGCSWHAGGNPPYVREEGIVSGHLGLTGIRPFNGRIVSLDILPNGGTGDFVSVDVWPVGSVGVGIVGARAKVLFVDAGLGVLFYHPKPAPYDLLSGEVQDSSELSQDSTNSKNPPKDHAPEEE